MLGHNLPGSTSATSYFSGIINSQCRVLFIFIVARTFGHVHTVTVGIQYLTTIAHAALIAYRWQMIATK